MAGLVGNIEEFREGIDWCQYIERLDLYFKANGIEAEEKRQATLLTVIGPAAYSLLRSLVSPAKPADKKYAELVQVMTEHYTPALSEIVERCKFNSRFRKDSETISEFIAALKSMAEHCNYGSTLGEMIRDRLVCGIRHDRIQRILLAEKKLDLTKAVDIATSVEMAERNVCDLQSTQAPRGNGATNKVFKQQAGHKKNKTGAQHRNSCYRCGQGHEKGKCKAVDATCHNCGKRGHFAKVCRSKTNSGQRTEVQTQFLAEISAEQSTPPRDNMEELEYFMHKAQASPKKEAPMLLELGISHNNTVMEIDTGATLSIVSEATYRAWKHQPQLSQSDVVLRTYTGDKIPVVGACKVNVRHDAQVLELPLLVVEGDGPNLLGRNWLARLKLDPSMRIPKPADYVLVMQHLESTPVTPTSIRQWTAKDPTLSRVREYVLRGWPLKCDEEISPYFRRRDELCVYDGCIMWGARVVIPPQGRNQLTEELHEAHPGISRMKSLARSYFWWPGMDGDLESKVKNCKECQQSRKLLPAAPLHPWEWPRKPWSRIHLDYAGPFMGRMFLVLVDSHSKWMDVFPVYKATSSITIEKLRETFAIHGLPELIVTDNGSVFTSDEFQQFLQLNGIRHVRTAPFHPSSNGLAERAVQSFKAAMKRMTNGTIETKLSRFLMAYRITPHPTTGTPPAQLLFNRIPRSRFDCVKPNMEERVQRKQHDQKQKHDQRAKARDFCIGDRVYVKNFASGPQWMPGEVISIDGVQYTLRLADDRICRRHIEHIRRRYNNDDMTADVFLPHPRGEGNNNAQQDHDDEAPALRRSNRQRKYPERFGEPIPH
ncbi:uncharacterized protein [Diadema setosum]|uniref:uncharacterized protein n=1 Tax=Diadema setosum TaxID=31175 RepID=UPI003B3B3AA8